MSCVKAAKNGDKKTNPESEIKSLTTEYTIRIREICCFCLDYGLKRVPFLLPPAAVTSTAARVKR